ncbi:hypothetical protein BGZ68_000999 [Mortierella alpina]|nr:hypothetical protein BGZ68_000999 [Mortierella alpina]
MVGGSIGRRKDPEAKIVIGVGLGKFGPGSGLTSMDQAFASYFIRTPIDATQCRALRYLVVGLNEFYTSKKCPDCRNFVAQVTLRQLYCPYCKVYFHRDVMAGNNLCNVIDGHLLKGYRPEYLQPINKDGTLPWMAAIDVTPGPNHYDVKLNDDDPYKRFGFLGKTKRFKENAKEQGPNGTSTPGHGAGPYERNALSVSLPSLVIDNDANSPDTASVYSNGSTTPDYTRYSRRPSTPRSKSTDKLGSAFTTNSSRTEERLKRELADLADKFEKYRVSHQRDLDAVHEKQKRGEVMYQGAVKEKNSILTQLAAKEIEIVDLGVRHTMLKATLEKSEKAAAQVSDKIGKTTQLQKRIDELEKLLNRTRLSLGEQESGSNEYRQRLDQERKVLQEQLVQQKQAADLELAHAKEERRLADERHQEEMTKAQNDSDFWKRKYEELEKIVKELERQLAAERRLIEELRAQMSREREQLQAQIDHAQNRIETIEKEKDAIATTSSDSIKQLQGEKETLDQQLQAAQSDFARLSEKYDASEQMLQQQLACHSETVQAMTRQQEEQQQRFERDQQEHSKARLELEQSIAELITELGQNRDTLLKVQGERSSLQDEYEQSKADLEQMTKEMKALKEQHKKLQESFTHTQEEWNAKYETLLAQSTSDKLEADATIEQVRTALQSKSEEYSQAMESIKAVQTELKTVDSEREEAVMLRLAEEKKVEASLEKISKLQQESTDVSGQLAALQKRHDTIQKEHERLQEEFQARELSAKESYQSELERVKGEQEKRDAMYQSRIQELEAMQKVSLDQTESFRNSEREWESVRIRLTEEVSVEKDRVLSLQTQLEEASAAKEQESKAHSERISVLQVRCDAMENAFKHLFEQSGSALEVDSSDAAEDIWQTHSQALMDALTNHTAECSTIKAEHAALVQEKAAMKQAAASVNSSSQEKPPLFKKTETDHSDLLAKLADLEGQIRLLKVQVELLEAENIGKVAIIKALQDEYEYQEKVIRDLSKNEDASKEVLRLEEELRTMTNHTRETDEWIKKAQEDIEKYRAAYVKADISREETLLDMAKLHEELAESQNAKLQVENQLQAEVSILIKKHGLSSDELSRLSKMDVDSAQNMSLKQKVKQVAQLKEENLSLKKKNLGLSNTRDSLRLKCLQVERELEAYKAATVSMSCALSTTGAGQRPSRSSSYSGASSVISSSSALLGNASTINLIVAEQPSPTFGKLQLQGLTPVVSAATRSRSASTTSTRSFNGGSTKTTGASTKSNSSNGGIASGKPPIRSRAARFNSIGHSTIPDSS